MDVVRISDGLGNQMFQYAFARKISLMTGHSVYLDTRFINNEDMAAKESNPYFKKKLAHREYGLAHFHIRLPAADEKVLFPWKYIHQTGNVWQAVQGLASHDMWLWRYKRENDNFDGRLSGHGMLLPTYYQGYFFDLAYYDDIKSVLRREFSLKDKVRLSRELRAIIDKKNTVSVHIRRGDFLKLNRDMSETGYYQKAISAAESRIANPFYLIFSDDIGWVKKNLDIHGDKAYISDMGFKDYEELTVMKHCRHNIIANSTFSYWAAYLNPNEDKVVICPRRWRSEIIPRQWLKV